MALVEPLAFPLLAFLAFVAYYAVLRRKSPVEILPTPVSVSDGVTLSMQHDNTDRSGPIKIQPGRELIWGHERLMYMNEPGSAIKRWTSELGLTYRIKAAFGANDVLVLSDPTAIAYILNKKIYDYEHSTVVRPRVARLLGRGLAWVEGQAEHKRMRHLVAPSLSAANVKAMSSDVRLAATQVVNDFAAYVQLEKQDGPINILDWTGKASLNIIGRVGFLHDFQGGKSSEAKTILGERTRGLSFVTQYAAFLTLMLLRRFPILNDLPIQNLRSQGFARMAIHSGVANDMVKRSVEDIDAKTQKDLLSRLLVAQAAGDLSKEELYEQISTFIISGTETTTQAISFTLYELSRRPEIQDRLREEIKAFPGEPTYDDYQTRLPYLDAVLKETLRVYPGLPAIERVATKPDTLPLCEPVKLSNGQTINQLPVYPGQVVMIPVMAIHRMDSVWKDPDSFRPERWLEDLPPSEQLCSGWSNLLAFSDGPRNCIGYKLAIFMYKVVLSYMLETFRFNDAGMDITLKVSSSLQAWVVDRPDLGACLPVQVELL